MMAWHAEVIHNSQKMDDIPSYISDKHFYAQALAQMLIMGRKRNKLTFLTSYQRVIKSPEHDCTGFAMTDRVC